MIRRRHVIDAEFEVVGNAYRVGERHREKRYRRWIYTGRLDIYGRPLWYRPPILSGWRYFAMLCVVTTLGRAMIVLIDCLIRAHRQ